MIKSRRVEDLLSRDEIDDIVIEEFESDSDLEDEEPMQEKGKCQVNENALLDPNQMIPMPNQVEARLRVGSVSTSGKKIDEDPRAEPISSAEADS